MSNNTEVPGAKVMFYQVYDRGQIDMYMGRVESVENDHVLREKRAAKGKLIMKTLRRCRSLGSLRHKGDHHHQQQKEKLPPEGCFSVYVGPGRERFTVRTECLNHSLFRALLDEAEMAFGYPAAGPLELPCDVGFFRRVLVQVEQDAAELHSPRCNFAKGLPAAGYLLMSPARSMIMGRV